MIPATQHKIETKIIISRKMKANRNAEKFDYDYAENLFLKSFYYAKENESLVIVEVATVFNVPKKRYSYLAKKFPSLKGLYSLLMDTLEVNTFRLTKTNQIPIRLGMFLLRYAYGWCTKPKKKVEPIEPISFPDLIEFE